MNKGRFAVITGASQGIGKAIAAELASRRYHLVMVALPDSGLWETAAAIEKRYGSTILCYEADLTNVDEKKKFCSWLESRDISLEVWVNNAGIGYEGAAHALAPEFLENLLQLNVQALAMLSLWFVKYLKKNQKKGHLMNVGSMASFFALPYKTFYSASKTFVLDFSRSLREEVKEAGINVSCLCPGPVNTNEKVIQRISGAGWRARYFTVTPEILAKKAVKGMFRKKSVIVPALGNKFLWLVSRLVPHRIVLRFSGTMFRKDKRLESKAGSPEMKSALVNS